MFVNPPLLLNEVGPKPSPTVSDVLAEICNNFSSGQEANRSRLHLRKHKLRNNGGTQGRTTICLTCSAATALNGQLKSHTKNRFRKNLSIQPQDGKQHFGQMSDPTQKRKLLTTFGPTNNGSEVTCVPILRFPLRRRETIKLVVSFDSIQL